MSEKTLTEFFSDIDIPAELEGATIQGARINQQNRSMSLMLKLPKIVDFEVFTRFKAKIVEYYSLNALTIKTKPDVSGIDSETLDKYRPYIIERLATQSSLYKYLFTDSKW